MLIGIFMLCYAYYPAISIKDKEYSLWLKMLMLCIALNMIAFHLNIAARLMWYIKPAIIVLLPNVFNEIPIKDNREMLVLLGIIGIICFLPYFMYYLPSMQTDNAGIVPYYMGNFF